MDITRGNPFGSWRPPAALPGDIREIHWQDFPRSEKTTGLHFERNRRRCKKIVVNRISANLLNKAGTYLHFHKVIQEWGFLY